MQCEGKFMKYYDSSKVLKIAKVLLYRDDVEEYLKYQEKYKLKCDQECYQSEKEIDDQNETPTDDQIDDQNENQVDDQNEAKVNDQYENKVDNQVENKVNDQNEDQMDDQNENKVDDQNENQAINQDDNQVNDQNENQMDDQNENQAIKKDDNQVNDQNENQAADQDENQVKDQNENRGNDQNDNQDNEVSDQIVNENQERAENSDQIPPLIRSINDESAEQESNSPVKNGSNYEENSNDRMKPNICLRAFKSFIPLKRLKLIHTGEKPFVCKICQKGFNQKEKLIAHEYTHSEKPYECEICLKTFKTKRRYTRHRNHSICASKIIFDFNGVSSSDEDSMNIDSD